MKKLFSLLLISLLSACSGEIDDEGNLVDIDQTQQAYTATRTANYQLGTQTSAAHRQCNRSSSGQVCSIPKTKNFTYCINSGFTNAENSLIANEVNMLDNLLTGWTFKLENDPLTGACLLSNTLQFSPGSCGSSGTSSSKIENYACNTLSGISNLTEGATGLGVVGSYQAHSFARGKIDITDINAKFSNATQRENAKRHAVKFILLSSIGLGSRNDGGSNTFGSRPDIANFVLGILTAGEKCRVDSFSTSNTTDYSTRTLLPDCNTVD
jgi:hypothetical protein